MWMARSTSSESLTSDVAHDRNPEEFHRLLTVHEQNDAGVPVAFQLRRSCAFAWRRAGAGG